MVGLSGAPRPYRRARAGPTAGRAVFAALDLGTNNCRLLVAEPSYRGFRVLDSYSSISRLGEGLARTGRLSPEAMDRTIAALRVCAQKLAVHPGVVVRAIATQACRVAENGVAFLERVRAETGLALEIVSPEEEARLAVIGCAALVDPRAEAALVLDIGGGSTELSWISGPASAPKILAWTSLNFGVVTLAEEYPEPETDKGAWRSALAAAVEPGIRAFAQAYPISFRPGAAHLVGTSGALSSLGGVHLRLPRYLRSKVDGLWLSEEEVRTAAQRVREMSRADRSAHPCIGPDRKDLIVPGAAIVEAVCAAWPIGRVRVADRGLREGVLLELIAKAGRT